MRRLECAFFAAVLGAAAITGCGAKSEQLNSGTARESDAAATVGDVTGTAVVHEVPRTTVVIVTEDGVEIVGAEKPIDSETCKFDPFAEGRSTDASCGDGLPSGVSTFDAPLGLGFPGITRKAAAEAGWQAAPVIPQFVSADARFYTDGDPSGRTFGISEDSTSFGKYFVVETYGTTKETVDEAVNRLPPELATAALRLTSGSTDAFALSTGGNTHIDIRFVNGWRVTALLQGERSLDEVTAFFESFANTRS